MTFHLPLMSPGKFTTSEVAMIAGMTQDLVRLWRSRGHIEVKGKRGAVYPAIEVAEIMIRYDLSRNGLAPKESKELGRTCALKIMQHVMFNHPSACEVSGSEAAVNWIRDLHQNSDRLTDFLFGSETGEELLVKVDDEEEFSWRPSTAPALDLPNYRTALVFNLEGYAARLVELAGKPIMHFNFEVEKGEEVILSTLAVD